MVVSGLLLEQLDQLHLAEMATSMHLKIDSHTGTRHGHHGDIIGGSAQSSLATMCIRKQGDNPTTVSVWHYAQ